MGRRSGHIFNEPNKGLSPNRSLSFWIFLKGCGVIGDLFLVLYLNAAAVGLFLTAPPKGLLPANKLGTLPVTPPAKSLGPSAKLPTTAF